MIAVKILICSVIIISIILIVFVIINLIGNEQNRIQSGTIIDKHHIPAKITMQQSGKIMVPITYPEEFLITIRGEKDGKLVDYQMNVCENEYNKYEIGNSYP